MGKSKAKARTRQRELDQLRTLFPSVDVAVVFELYQMYGLEQAKVHLSALQPPAVCTQPPAEKKKLDELTTMPLHDVNCFVQPQQSPAVSEQSVSLSWNDCTAFLCETFPGVDRETATTLLASCNGSLVAAVETILSYAPDSVRFLQHRDCQHCTRKL